MGIQRAYLKLGQIFSVNLCQRPLTTTIEGRLVNQRNTYGIRSILDTQRNVSSFIEGNYVWYSIGHVNQQMVACQNVYNFEVTEDNSYIVENVIVHNCQSFSNAGKKKASLSARGLLFNHIVRILKDNHTPFALLENVKHIKKVSNGAVYRYIYDQLHAVGYQVFDVELSPMDLKIPQNRERVIFVVIRNDLYMDRLRSQFLETLEIKKQQYRDKNRNLVIFEESPSLSYMISEEISHVVHVWDEFIQIFSQVGEIISPVITEYFTASESPDNSDWKNDYIRKNREFYLKHHELIDPWIDRNRKLLTSKVIYGKLEWQTGGIHKNDSIYNYFIQMRQSGIHVSKKQIVFPALVAIVQTPIIAGKRRYLTPRECARLQSFPDDFTFGQQSDKLTYKQLGNGINVEIVKIVAETLLNTYSAYFSELHH